MPTYEYECRKCHRVFEVRQRISDPPLETCEACGGEVRRLLSPAPFILKGGGWYVTDYPSESRKKAVESEKSAGDKPGGSDKKTDSSASTTTTASATASSAASTSSDSTSSDSKKKPD